jgi:hypothetical protein
MGKSGAGIGSHAKWNAVWQARMTSQGPNRLQVCTFLGSVTLAAFAALQAPALSGGAKGDDGYCSAWFGPCFVHLGLAGSQWSLLGVQVSLGTASILFLVATLYVYRALQDIAYASTPTQASKRVRDIRKRAYQRYHTAGLLMPWGLYALGLSLGFVGVRISLAFTLAAGGIGGGLLWHHRRNAWQEVETMSHGNDVPDVEKDTAAAEFTADLRKLLEADQHERKQLSAMIRAATEAFRRE